MANLNTQRIAFIGFGEVGARFARDLMARPHISVSAYDKKLDDAATAAPVRERAEETRTRLADTLAEAIAEAPIVLSAVTASQTIAAAEAARTVLRPGQIYFDVNSAAPRTKSKAHAVIAASGASYVEGAVMAAVAAPGIAVPILAGGVAAWPLAETLNAIGFKITPVSEDIGRASAMKLCRSIVIKGLETLMVDCAEAARRGNVENEVFQSLNASYPGIDWQRLAADMRERVETHGIRRSEEMMEAAEMVRDIGLDPALAEAIAGAQRRGAKKH
jgi:3-hydroxyisobutyrate dehydrogenase-like beta-hydroxyacid dehydrogenase